jgi:hypothetical protein
MNLKIIKILLLFLIVFSASAIANNVKADTEIGGIIHHDTTWTASGGPYNITDTVQIPDGITLTIEAGTQINHKILNDPGKQLFTVKGNIKVRGDSNNLVYFNSSKNGLFFNFEFSDNNTNVEINYSKFLNGRFAGVRNSASLQIKNSIFKDVQNLPEYYTNQGGNDIYIENNIFINSGTLAFLNSCGDDRRFYIRNNYFFNCIGGGCIHSAACQESMIVEYNSFLEPNKTNLGSIAVTVDQYHANSGIQATNNYWGTNNIDVINEMIYDKNDNIAIDNEAAYLPILSSHHKNTPLPILCSSWEYTEWKHIGYQEIREIIKAYPDNCMGGNPLLVRDYVVPVTTNQNNELIETNNQLNTENKNEEKQVSTININEFISSEKNKLTTIDANLSKRLSGKILLQVENNGEGWYVNPENQKRYYLGRPDDAFGIMRKLGLGITNKDFDSYNNYAPKRLSGKILLKVQDSGKAYYVNPNDLKMHYLGRPQDAFNLMRSLGLGISTNDIRKVDIY